MKVDDRLGVKMQRYGGGGWWWRVEAGRTWRECVQEDTRRLLLKREDAQDRVGWRSDVLGDRLTRASADTNHNRRNTLMMMTFYPSRIYILVRLTKQLNPAEYRANRNLESLKHSNSTLYFRLLNRRNRFPATGGTSFNVSTSHSRCNTHE